MVKQKHTRSLKNRWVWWTTVSDGDKLHARNELNQNGWVAYNMDKSIFELDEIEKKSTVFWDQMKNLTYFNSNKNDLNMHLFNE